MKQERWGKLILIRPDAAATWSQKNSEAWKKWDGWFHPHPKGSHGQWEWKKEKPQPWILRYSDLQFYIHPTTSKQVGLFPEQAINWDWCREKIKASLSQGRSIKLLNLFGYTGAATIAAAQAGATVCHVDASKAMVSWCAQNAALSQKKLPIRFIVDDCLKFLQREQRRGQRYEAIILDPPTFGRGAHGEVWNIKDQLPTLLRSCKALLSERPLFLLMNTYSAALSPRLLHSICEKVFPKEKKSKLTIAALELKGSEDQKVVPCGITTRWEGKELKG